MAENIMGLKRTHRCAEVSAADVGREITVMGWVQKRRDLGALLFVTLRDRSGILQIVVNSETHAALHAKALQVRAEYVVAVRGTLAARDADAVNPNMATGAWELVAEEFRILSKAETPPFHIEDNTNANEVLRLKHRYLDLRRPDMQKNLMLRHRLAKCARDHFNDAGFLEIETPMLTKSTPEGARDYLVPSRVQPGKFFALPQSPQLFKQLLMVSGFDRYMQITKCFRDEDLRADRQPEFTQIDLEMAFVDVDDVIAVNEAFLQRAFREVLGVEVAVPFKRIPYVEAMSRYGSDKPDTRFGMELVDCSDLVGTMSFKVFSDAVEAGGSVRAINASQCAGSYSRKEIDALGEVAKTYKAKGLAWIVLEAEGFRSSFSKFVTDEALEAFKSRLGAVPGDLLLFVADKDEVVFDALGHLRLAIAEKMGLLKPNTWDLLWVTEFPLLERDEEAGRWVAKHHPFTAPMDEDMPFLTTDPGRVRAKAYDIVLNGVELGGGSIRIHDQELQQLMFRTIGFTEEQANLRFGFLLDAFRYGTPPHGGLAFGLDRIAMLMLGTDSIRDVIAFPKVQTASCLMTGAPDVVDDKQLAELQIASLRSVEEVE
jgi:aspartyl-tRNA synthetase